MKEKKSKKENLPFLPDWHFPTMPVENIVNQIENYDLALGSGGQKLIQITKVHKVHKVRFLCECYFIITIIWNVPNNYINLELFQSIAKNSIFDIIFKHGCSCE
jgi:hypothetical protein